MIVVKIRVWLMIDTFFVKIVAQFMEIELRMSLWIFMKIGV